MIIEIHNFRKVHSTGLELYIIIHDRFGISSQNLNMNDACSSLDRRNFCLIINFIYIIGVTLKSPTR